MHHVDHPTQIGAAAGPPGESVVDQEVVPHRYAKVLAQLLYFGTVQERLVHAAGHTATERRGSVVLLDLPTRTGIVQPGVRPIHPARECAHRPRVLGESNQPSWVI